MYNECRECENRRHLWLLRFIDTTDSLHHVCPIHKRHAANPHVRSLTPTSKRPKCPGSCMHALVSSNFISPTPCPHNNPPDTPRVIIRFRMSPLVERQRQFSHQASHPPSQNHQRQRSPAVAETGTLQNPDQARPCRHRVDSASSTLSVPGQR